ncbi:hypothetical protein [Streptococcus marmotae]|uniref:hypothetical protein n=1 Tax=Streptococcus marmotae TaxID=1825069 RepID=UPI000830E555|nr:hypothetical protein [Streptococcus marmotae]
MNFTIENIISFVGAMGISTIIGTVISFVQTNKKHKLDLVTRERSEWRKQLKKIIKNLDDENNRAIAISELKSQINPYGRNMDIKNTKPYFMKDGHIWDMLEMGEKVNYEKLIFFVELLLKYDWERSKKEVEVKPYELIHGMIRFTLIILHFYSIYLIYKTVTKLGDIMVSINIGISVLVVLLLLMQRLVTTAIILNPSKKRSEQFWIFMLFYALPYAYVVNNLVDYLSIRESAAIKVIALIGMFIYEVYYLSFFDSYEDRYVKEIERYLSVRSRKYQESIELANRIRGREDKLYQYEYNISAIHKMNKKLKKIKKKLTKKKRPQEYWLHPILFFKYRRNRKRIIREVKKWKKEIN